MMPPSLRLYSFSSLLLSIACTGVSSSDVWPEGGRRATSVNVQLPRLQKDLRTGSISQDVNFPHRHPKGEGVSEKESKQDI